MGTCIMKLDGRYLEWSTIVDAPVTELMTLEEFETHYRYQYGQEGMDGLPRRMKRVEDRGNSFFGGMTNDDIIRHNRAGEGETKLTREEIIEQYGGENETQDS